MNIFMNIVHKRTYKLFVLLLRCNSC